MRDECDLMVQVPMADLCPLLHCIHVCEHVGLGSLESNVLCVWSHAVSVRLGHADVRHDVIGDVRHDFSLCSVFMLRSVDLARQSSVL